ncbi:MAG: hypothetical protein M3Z92_15035 [Bacteroidota bacterium]|nr:hypothetical protein [Bacteroidota bacterium]MDQ6889774.1 hypothetical protein [Bacteroidota bacterium]
MKKYFFPAIILFSLLFSCNSDETKKADTEQKSYVDTKKALLEKEQKKPVNFINVKGQDKRNLLGQTVVKCILTNNAKIATYKDVDLKLSFYSKTKALLETDKETVFEVISPGQSKNFKTKYFAPKGTDSVSLEVLGAKVVE